MIKGMQEAKEIRFAFGKNRSQFLSTIDDQKIKSAMDSLKEKLQCEDLQGKTFLDIGSGLFSLAARKLGAQVHFFDYDADSVACTEALRGKYFTPDDAQWIVKKGDVLNTDYLKNQVNLTWGVLHHTGDLWRALEGGSAVTGHG